MTGDIDVFRVDHLTFKEIASSKIDSLNNIFKNFANENFAKVRELEADVNVMKEEFLKAIEENIKEAASLFEKIEHISDEIAEIKNERKALTNLK